MGSRAEPTYTGRQLASTLGLSESTVSRAKRKLYEEGYLQTVRIPDLRRMGAGLLTVVCHDNTGDTSQAGG